MKQTKKFNEFVQEDRIDLELEAEKKPGPDAYMTGLDDEEEEDKEDQIKKQAAMDDDDPNAYKEMPGDKEARDKGKVKTSKHTKAYAKIYDEFTVEGVMSDIHLMADEVKSEDEFIKRFFSEYGNKIKKTKDSEEWVRSMYNGMVSEAIDEKKYFYFPKYDNAGYTFAEKLISDLRSKHYKKWNDEEFDEFRRAMINHFDLEIPEYLRENDNQIGQLDSMAYGQLERCVDYATMIRDRYDDGYSFDSWMYGKITKAEEHLNAVFDSMDGDDGVIESTVHENFKNDLKKFVKKNEKEIDRLADDEDWDQIYNMIYSEFDIDPKSDAGKEVRTLLNIVY